MKKSLILALLLGASLSLSACGSEADSYDVETEASEDSEDKDEEKDADEEDDEQQGDEEDEIQAEEDDEDIVGMANPMEEIQDESEFEINLGFALDPSALSNNVTMYIIGGEIAEIRYEIADLDGNSIEAALRASKTQDDISGVYGMTEGESIEIDDVTITHSSLEEENIEVYEFSYDGVNYSYMVKGQISQMRIAELLDSVLAACGITQ